MGSNDPRGEAGKPKPPTAADVAKIPTLVRDHAVQMSRAAALTRETRKRWYEIRARFIAGRDVLDSEIAAATGALWEHERALAAAAAVHREHLAENDRRPPGDRWSPTALYTWVALTQVVKKPE
jgi:hypothetical protein